MRVAVWAKLQVLRHEHGQDLVDYAMLMAFVVVAALVGITALGNTIDEALYHRFVTKLLAAFGGP